MNTNALQSVLLTQPTNNLNRNRIFCFPAHHAEKSRFFAFARVRDGHSVPYRLNQKVKP